MKTPDEIKKGLECCAGMHDHAYCKQCPYAYVDCDEMSRDALTYIQQLEAAYPKWISVKERLPEDGQRVVGIAENGMTGIMDYRDDGTPFAARIFGVYFSNITHWMHLPCAPKEEA